MSKIEESRPHFFCANSLESTCNALRHAILRLPRGVLRERLFVSLLKAMGHGHRQRFVLMKNVLSSMRMLAQDPTVSGEVTLLLDEASHALEALLNAPSPSARAIDF